MSVMLVKGLFGFANSSSKTVKLSCGAVSNEFREKVDKYSK